MTSQNATIENKDLIFRLAEKVYKHKGRFSTVATIDILYKLYTNQEPTNMSTAYPLYIYFMQACDFAPFVKDCNNEITLVPTNTSNDYLVQKTRVYNDFEQLKNEYHGDYKLVKMVDGKFQVQYSLFTIDLRTENHVFRVPFIEPALEFSTSATLRKEYLDNLQEKKWTINWNVLFENYSKFDNIDKAISEFILCIGFYWPQHYSVFSRNRFIGKGYDCGSLKLLAETELKAYIASKQEYTVEHAKKDIESGKQLIDQGHAMIQKGAAFLTK